MIDPEGFRLNVGIVLVNSDNKVLWAKRKGAQAAGYQNCWQFPQGGIQENETAHQALYRELQEELGLSPEQVKLLSEMPEWLRYFFPKPLFFEKETAVCVGQKQRWFLLRLLVDDSHIGLDRYAEQELDAFEWVDHAYALQNVVAFKKEVYAEVLAHFFEEGIEGSLTS